jgi:hypothetical protein
MTTKEIAEAVGKPERTVQRWAKTTGVKLASIGVKLASVAKSGKPADYDLDETCAIIEHGLGKNAARLFRENAKHALSPAQGSSLTARDMEVIGGIVASVMANLTARLGNIENVIDQRRALLPAPEVKPRDNISRIVRKYAHDNGIEYGPAWGELYREYGYRTNSNPSVAARNRGMAIIDYIEAEGMVGTLEAIAIDWAK